jgi:hypothetical protein
MTTMEKETTALIGSDKVEGTAVYGMDGTNIGSIQRVMIDKISGKVAYAVTSFGGFLGIGEEYFPLLWSQLRLPTLSQSKGRHAKPLSTCARSWSNRHQFADVRAIQSTTS